VLAPLRAANIPVLPVAGNHDSYMQWQRDLYAKFANLSTWAPDLEIHDARGQRQARAPFSYSVDVDTVHFALTHIVETELEPEVATWLANDLAQAANAQHRIVFGHVPLTSTIWATNQAFLDQMGTILERGKATLHVAGHEHLAWDEVITLPGGTPLRQVLVGCSSGFYQYAPNAERKAAAKCTPLPDKARKEPMRCTMPASGGTFEIARGRKNRHVQHARTTFALFTVNGDTIDVQPMMLDAKGRAVSFYLDQ
jgi:Calcineurin-like phosphoesterase